MYNIQQNITQNETIPVNWGISLYFHLVALNLIMRIAHYLLG